MSDRTMLRSWRCWQVAFFLSPPAVVMLCCGVLGLFMRDEEIHRFDLPGDRTITLYAESDFHYEPPGYLKYQVREKGEVRVPRRSFYPTGSSDRIPQGTFDLVESEDGQLVAVQLGRDVVILHDFSTNRTWSRNYSIAYWADFLLAKEFLTQFAQEGKTLQCEVLEKYLADRLPSPDGSRVVTHLWHKTDGDVWRLRVRVVDADGVELHLLETDDRVVFDAQEDCPNWRAGWLDDSRFGVWAEAFGARVWRFEADGSCSAASQPIDPEIEASIRQLRSSPRWIMYDQ